MPNVVLQKLLFCQSHFVSTLPKKVSTFGKILFSKKKRFGKLLGTPKFELEILSLGKEKRAQEANKKAADINKEKDEISDKLKKLLKSAGVSRRKKKRNIRRELDSRRRNKRRHRRREAGKIHLFNPQGVDKSPFFHANYELQW